MFNFFKRNKNTLTESTKSFKNKGKSGVSQKFLENTRGEGFEDIYDIGYGKENISSFNSFYNNYINTAFTNKRAKIQNYRTMSDMPEISSIIEDICIESTQEDVNGKILTFEILNKDIESNKNIVSNLEENFDELFHKNLKINTNIIDYIRSYYIDSEIFLEKVINKSKKSLGVIKLKKLPTETVDYHINRNTGEIDAYYQYLKPNAKEPTSIEDAESRDDVILFYPEQISHVDYGIYAGTKKNVVGYLEKAKQPFNQLKLIETSIVIYRIVRSPERLVFNIDTGAMPRDKSLKFVEKIKNKLTQKVEFDSQSGTLKNQPNITSLIENYFLPQCLRLNTKVDCLDGTSKTLKHLISDYNNGIKNEVLSVDQTTGEILKGEITWAGITRKNAKLVRVFLDNDEYVDVTPDHKFVMRDGTEKEACDLQNNDSLMPYYTRTRKVYKTSNTYNQVYDIKDNEYKFIHRIIKPVSNKGNVIHHRDFNRYNNMSSNLVEMDSKDHIRYHSKIGGIYLKQYWKDNYDVFYDNVSKPKTTQHKNNLSKSIKNKWNDTNYRSKVSLSSKMRWKNKEFSDHMSKVQSIVIDDKCLSMFTEIYTKNIGMSIPTFINELSSNDTFISYWGYINDNIKNVKKDRITKSSFYKIINGFGYNDYTEFKQNTTINHKVKKVEILEIREDTGCITVNDINNNHNFPLSIGVFVKNSSDGRGSSISSVGGNPSGFAELDDLYYFARKLYTALKYPISRITNVEERRQGDTLFQGSQSSEITIDEIRWSKFLERHQQKFCQMFTELFLVHLEFKGLKKEYDININDINVVMTPPNDYKQQMNQSILETQMNNYSNLANNQEFSKSFLMSEYLKWDDEMIKLNAEGHKKDKELFPQDDY